jgi:hypothetical protein
MMISTCEVRPGDTGRARHVVLYNYSDQAIKLRRELFAALKDACAPGNISEGEVDAAELVGQEGCTGTRTLCCHHSCLASAGQ